MMTVGKYNIDSEFSDKLSSVISIHDLENAFLNQDKRLILRTFRYAISASCKLPISFNMFPRL